MVGVVLRRRKRKKANGNGRGNGMVEPEEIVNPTIFDVDFGII